jgi:hypothetical protein
MRYIQLWGWGLTVAGTDLIKWYSGDEPNPGRSTWLSASVFWERWKVLFWWRRVAAECWSNRRRCWNNSSGSVRSDGWQYFRAAWFLLASVSPWHAGRRVAGLAGSSILNSDFTPCSGFGSGTVRCRSTVEPGAVRWSKDRLTSHREGMWVAVYCTSRTFAK